MVRGCARLHFGKGPVDVAGVPWSQHRAPEGLWDLARRFNVSTPGHHHQRVALKGR